MLSIELNLLCEKRGKCIGSCVTSTPTSDINYALESVIADAHASGWVVEVINGKLVGLCQDCLATGIHRDDPRRD